LAGGCGDAVSRTLRVRWNHGTVASGVADSIRYAVEVILSKAQQLL
jgi:hypothetical protein